MVFGPAGGEAAVPASAYARLHSQVGGHIVPYVLCSRGATGTTDDRSDASEEAAGVEGVGGIELMLDGFHEGKGVAGNAPGIEGGKLGGATENDEGAGFFFEVTSQTMERALQAI